MRATIYTDAADSLRKTPMPAPRGHTTEWTYHFRRMVRLLLHSDRLQRTQSAHAAREFLASRVW